MTPQAWVMVVGGVLLGLLGFAVLWVPQLGARGGVGRAVGSLWVSESTRLCAGVGALLVAYHLVVWGVGVSGYGVPVRFWGLLVGGVVVAVGGNALMDRGQGGASNEASRVDESDRG